MKQGLISSPYLSVYQATKHAVVALTESLRMELELMGTKLSASVLCPGFVATPMTDWVEDQVPKEDMIQPDDIAEGVRFLLRTSPACIVPEIQFVRPGDLMRA